MCRCLKTGLRRGRSLDSLCGSVAGMGPIDSPTQCGATTVRVGRCLLRLSSWPERSPSPRPN